MGTEVRRDVARIKAVRERVGEDIAIRVGNVAKDVCACKYGNVPPNNSASHGLICFNKDGASEG